MLLKLLVCLKKMLSSFNDNYISWRFCMSTILEKIENDALRLSKQERAFLADRLLSSLDGDALTDVDEAWVAEAERRYKEYKEGKQQGISAKNVFAEADRMLK
jgi:putative addiction module component (TIGR02574 family)